MTVVHEPDRRAAGEPLWVTGLIVAAAALAASWFAAALLGVDVPLVAVGTRVIDASPRWLKEFAISAFGTSDKLALEIGTAALMVLAARALAGLARERFVAAAVGVSLFGAVGLASARWSLDGSAVIWPNIVGVAAAVASMRFLTPARAVGSSKGPTRAPTAQPIPRSRAEVTVDRRVFVSRAAALSAATAALGGGAALVGGRTNAQVASARRSIALNAPADPAPRLPDGVDLGRGSAPWLTPSDRFYRIDTALSVPRVDVDRWRLEVVGMVARPLTLSFSELADRPLVERTVTLCCVSNEVGGDLIGNATWLGVPLAELLDEAGLDPSATQVASRSVDGWTCGFPTAIALDGRDAMVAIGMNGEPLPVKHGFPARLVVPGLYGYVSATKWLSRIEATTLEGFDGYWIPRGWSKLGPVKTQSRIDVPAPGGSVRAGTVAVAGVAWAQHRGIDRVEVRIDDGEWSDARLGADATVDSWRQWVYEWDATPGTHSIAVRATDRDGETQTSTPSPVAPDGATGWHTIEVDVGS